MAKAYVLKTAGNVIAHNCEAHLENRRLTIKTAPHEKVSDVLLFTDAAVSYEIVFSNGSSETAAFGMAQKGTCMVRAGDNAGLTNNVKKNNRPRRTN